nr:MAG TPA: hypothetical protein [Caudoviricetes sp.]
MKLFQLIGNYAFYLQKHYLQRKRKTKAATSLSMITSLSAYGRLLISTRTLSKSLNACLRLTSRCI